MPMQTPAKKEEQTVFFIILKAMSYLIFLNYKFRNNKQFCNNKTQKKHTPAKRLFGRSVFSVSAPHYF